MADGNENKNIHQTAMTSPGEQTGPGQFEDTELELVLARAAQLQLAPPPPVQISHTSVSASLSQHTGTSSSVNVSGSHSPAFLGQIKGSTLHFHFGSDTKGPEHPPARIGQDSLRTFSHRDANIEGCQGRYHPKQAEGSLPARKVSYAEIQSAADSCEEVLKIHYKTTGSYVQLIPWVDDDNKHIMDIYTELLLEEEQFLEKLESYEGIFCLRTREDDPIKRVVLVGLAGRGKSTLVDKMAYDWAVFSQALRQFKLVFVLKLGALEPRSDLVDAIFDQLLDQDTRIDRSALQLFIQTHPKDVLILMDGFDELIVPNPLGEIPSKSILTPLSRKSCRECWVVVTTRPSHLDRLVTRKLVQKPFASVRVTGFTEENILEYVDRFYSDDRDNADGFRRRIGSSCVMADLAKSPMLLLLMCLMWRQDCTLPDTLSRLFSEAIVYIFKRKTVVSLDCVLNVVIKVGKIALRGLLSPETLLSFDEREFEQSTLTFALNAGLLTRQRVLAKGLRTCTNVQFIHKTFQEYCAAKYLQSMSEVEFLEALNQSALFDFCESEHLLRFCCGDNETCTRNVLRVFAKGLSMNQGLPAMSCQGGSDCKRQLQLALECCFESQSESSSPDEFTSWIVTDEITLQEWDADSLNSFSFFMKCVAAQTAGGGNSHLSRVKKIQLERCDLHMSSEGLAYSLRAMTSLLSLSLLQCSLTSFDLGGLMSCLIHSTSLTELDLSDTTDLNHSAESWSLHFQNLKPLKSLRLSGCFLSSQTGKHIIEFLSGCPKLTHLDLSRNFNLGDSGELCFPHLRHCRQLQTLDLSFCQLEGRSMTYIAEAMGHMPDLIESNLSMNRSLGGTASLWSAQLKRCKQLRKLRLKYCSMTGEDLSHFALSLSKMTELVELDLSLDDDHKPVWGHLERLSGLSMLDVTRCSLTVDDLQEIVEALKDNVNLVEMHLSFGNHLNNSIDIWAPHLKHLKHIQTLMFVDCSLERDELTCLAISVACMRNIVKCVVDHTYGMSATRLVAQTIAGPSVDLSRCSLSNTGLKDILEGLGNRDDVVELNLGGNSLCGSAEIWSVHLKRMKRLQKLGLSRCSLTYEDMKEIGGSLCSLPDLTEVDLSFNGPITEQGLDDVPTEEI